MNGSAPSQEALQRRYGFGSTAEEQAVASVACRTPAIYSHAILKAEAAHAPIRSPRPAQANFNEGRCAFRPSAEQLSGAGARCAKEIQDPTSHAAQLPRHSLRAPTASEDDLLLCAEDRGIPCSSAGPPFRSCLCWLLPKEAVSPHSFQAVYHLAKQPRQLLMDAVLAAALTTPCVRPAVLTSFCRSAWLRARRPEVVALLHLCKHIQCMAVYNVHERLLMLSATKDLGRAVNPERTLSKLHAYSRGYENPVCG